MRDPKAEGRRWLSQAENDLAFARHARSGGFHHQVCFVAQQCAEKALKAMLYRAGARSVLGHSVVGLLAKLTQQHPNLAKLRPAAADLDLCYVSTRDPSGLAEGVPHEAFTPEQAERALGQAGAILGFARDAIEAAGRG